MIRRLIAALRCPERMDPIEILEKKKLKLLVFNFIASLVIFPALHVWTIFESFIIALSLTKAWTYSNVCQSSYISSNNFCSLQQLGINYNTLRSSKGVEISKYLGKEMSFS